MHPPMWSGMGRTTGPIEHQVGHPRGTYMTGDDRMRQQEAGGTHGAVHLAEHDLVFVVSHGVHHDSRQTGLDLIGVETPAHICDRLSAPRWPRPLLLLLWLFRGLQCLLGLLRLPTPTLLPHRYGLQMQRTLHI